MPNKIEKFLRTLDSNRRAIIDALLQRISRGNFVGLDIKKLQGSSNRYRIRKGDIRIKFTLNEKGKATEIEISRRNDTTYNL